MFLTILVENPVFCYSIYARLKHNLPLFYSFVRILPDRDDVEAETCRRHIVKWKWFFDAGWAVVGLNAVQYCIVIIRSTNSRNVIYVALTYLHVIYIYISSVSLLTVFTEYIRVQ